MNSQFPHAIDPIGLVGSDSSTVGPDGPPLERLSVTARMSSRRWLIRASLVAVSAGSGIALGLGSAAAQPITDDETPSIVQTELEDSDAEDPQPQSGTEPTSSEAQTPAGTATSEAGSPELPEPVASEADADESSTLNPEMEETNIGETDIGTPDADPAALDEDPVTTTAIPTTADAPTAETTESARPLDNAEDLPAHHAGDGIAKPLQDKPIDIAPSPAGSVNHTSSPAAGPEPIVPVTPTTPPTESNPSVLESVVGVLLDLAGVASDAEYVGDGQAPPIEGLWLAARDSQARTSAQRSASRTTGSAPTDTSSEGHNGTVDEGSGAVSGTIDVVVPEGTTPVYVTTNSPDPGIGTFAIDSATGRWTFTPSNLLRRLAARSTGEDTLGVDLLVGLGETIVPVTVTVPIVPLALTPSSQHTLDPITGTVSGSIVLPGGTVGAPVFVVTNEPDKALGDFTLDSTSGSWTFTPTTVLRNLAAQTAGEDAFDVTLLVGDGNEVASVTISLPIAPPVNQTPTVTTDVSDTTVDPITGTVSGWVRASDPEGDQLVFVVANAPDSSLGSFTLDSTSGRWTFTPTPELRDLAAQSPGDDSFGVTVLVGDGASVGSVVIDVPIAAALGPNRAPVFVDGPGSTTVDPRSGAVSGILTATDADGNPLTFTIVSGPQVAAGTVEIDSATGRWTLTPGGDTLMSAYFSGQPTTLTFTASVSDGALSSSRTITVPVTLSRDELVTMLERDGSRPVALAVGADGRLYVVDEGANTLTIVDRVAGTSHSVATGRAPTDVAVSSDGLVYVSNGQDNTVFVYNADGYLYRQLNVGAGPTSITVAPDGRAYVTTRTGLGVVIIDAGAYSVSSFAVAVPGADQVSVAADGTVFVLEHGSSSVTVVDPTTESVRSVSGSWSAGSMAVSADGVVFLTDPEQGVVIRLTPDGAGGFIEHLIDAPGAPGAVTIGADGLIRLADVSTGSILIMNSQGDVLSQVVVDSTPSKVVVDAAGNAYVIGLDAADITIIDEGGTVSTWDAAVVVNNITVGQAGELIVVNKYTGSVSVVSAATDLSSGYHITNAVHFGSTVTSAQVAYGADGALYVARASYFETDVYRMYNNTYQWARVGNFLSGSREMLVSDDGRVYVFWTGPHSSQGLAQMDFDSRGNIPIPTPYRILTVRLGVDGTILVADDSAGDLVFIDPDSFAGIRRVHLWAPNQYGAVTMDVSADGSIYLIPTSDGQKKLSVLNSTGDLMREVELPWNSGVIEVGSDGKVYLANELGQIFVLSSDFESITVMPTGVTPQAIVEGPNGLIFVSTGQGTLVIDPMTYAIDSESGVGTILDMYSRPGGPIYLVEFQSSYNATAFDIDIIGDPIPDAPDYPDPEPVEDPGQPIQFEQSPATFEALYDRLWSKPGNDDGIHTEIVRDWDGARKVVVYLGGTAHNWGFDHQSWASNAPTYVGLLKPHHLEMIDAAIAQCGDDCSEMMLVGYSQGGMDALNLADHYSDLTTTVITFGAPINQSAQRSDSVVHIRDTRDPIPALSNTADYWVASWNGQVFKGSTRNGWGMGLHGDKKTYLTLGRELDKSTDSKYLNIKSALTRFQGDIMPEPVITEF